MSTFCEEGHHDVPSIREASGQLVHSVKACTECTPAYLAKMMTMKEEADDAAPAHHPE